MPPFAAWKGLPGFDRLERALALAEQAAFIPAGLRIRQAVDALVLGHVARKD